MVNKRQRGNAFQDWIEDWIIDNFPGASVHNQKTVANKLTLRDKYTGEMKEVWVSKRNDILGCIDLLAIIPGKKPLFIQATLDSGVGRKLQDLVAVRWPLEYCREQLWLKREDGVIIIKKFTGDALLDIGQIVRRKYYRLEEGGVANGEHNKSNS